MKTLVPALFLAVALPAAATEWIEVGADTEAKYYVDVDSIQVDGENVRVRKKGIYTHVLTDSIEGRKASFKETVGVVELDCGRRINRVVQIDMLDESGAVVWSSGPRKRVLWEEVKAHTHGENTLDLVCSRVRKT
jgi:hypothetical protein